MTPADLAAETPDQIIARILKARSVTHEQLLSTSKDRWLVGTRRLVSVALMALPGMTYGHIATILGKDRKMVERYVKSAGGVS